MTREILMELEKRLAVARIEFSSDEGELFRAGVDHTRFSAQADLLVCAKTTGEIGEVLKIANALEVPVTVRGAGTGCAAGAVPFCGGVVLDLSKINFIKIDPVARIAHVGAGAVTANVDAEAARFGLFYAPDPSSHKFSTIGGNISCNAGGLRAAKYGVTRDNVLALTAFLASGEKISCARPLVKFSVGPNLRDFFIGSEGQFGVVAEAWLKLLPKPTNSSAAIALFKGDERGFEAIENTMRSSLRPCVLEFMDVETVECVRCRNPDLNLPEDSCALLARFDSADAQTEARAFADLHKDASGGNSRAAVGEEEADKLWTARRAASQAMYLLADSKLSQDICLPFEKVSEFFKFFKALGVESGFATPVFGHAADGNYHIHLMYNSSDEGARERALDAMDKAMKCVIKLGGAVSGEHGIGALKAKYMSLQHSEIELNLMRRLKEVFDPKHILNRGKVFSSEGLEGKKPLTGLKLPWD